MFTVFIHSNNLVLNTTFQCRVSGSGLRPLGEWRYQRGGVSGCIVYRLYSCIVYSDVYRCIAVSRDRRRGTGRLRCIGGIQHVGHEGWCEESKEGSISRHPPAHSTPPGTSQQHPIPLGKLIVLDSRTSSRRCAVYPRYIGAALSRAACRVIQRYIRYSDTSDTAIQLYS